MKTKIFFTAVIIFGLMSCKDAVEKIPKNIDHLVYTAPSLEQGIKEVEALLGIKPVVGGRHPNFGTRNALLSLGDSIYLEILAPDPNSPAPERGRLLQASYTERPRLTTWVLRTEQIEKVYTKAIQNGLTLGAVESGKREKPDGTTLAWKLTDPYAFPYSGALPFLISWGETPHPAKAVPKVGELVGLEIEHPDPDKINESLRILNVNIKVTIGIKTKIRAKIKTVSGIVILE